MSTGRNSCPPDWVMQLANAIGSGGSGAGGLPLQPLCDAAGVTVGYAAAVYNAATGQSTILRFDANLQPLATLPTGLGSCAGGGGTTTITNALAFGGGVLTSIVNGQSAAVPLRGQILQSLGGVSLGYLLPM